MSPEALERNFRFMFYGFSVVWMVLAIYAVYLFLCGRKISSQIETLKRMAQQSEKK
jgi:CcmD family protein